MAVTGNWTLRLPPAQLIRSFDHDSINERPALYHSGIALNQMAGKATGERIPGKKYRAIVEAAAIGDPINRIARKVGVTWRTVKAVVERESREIAERKQELLDQSIRVAKRALDRVEDQLDDANLSQANFVYGTSTDKIALLSGDPALIIRHEHLHAHKHEHGFKAITRETWDAILAALPDDNISQSTLATPIVPSLSPPEQQDNTDNANAAPTMPLAAPAMPVNASNTAPAMHSHSQTGNGKKADTDADEPEKAVPRIKA